MRMMLLVRFKEFRCILAVLEILMMNTGTYTSMLKRTKVSHTTLQRVLTNLANVGAITKRELGHRKVEYKITAKGRKLFKHLHGVRELLKN